MERQLHISKLLLKFHILYNELKSNPNQNPNIFHNYCNYANNSNNYHKNKFIDENK